MDFWSVAWMVSIIFAGITMVTFAVVIYITHGEQRGMVAFMIGIMGAGGMIIALACYYFLTTMGYTKIALMSFLVAGVIGVGLMKRARSIKKQYEASL